MIKFKHLPALTCPVVAVIGTGSGQGKITTQLRLRNILRSAGYKVSHVSTEPQASLFGADALFPYGHNSTVYLDLNRWEEFLQFALQGVQHFNTPNIIITGTQGGVVPKTPGATSNFEASVLRTLQYLIGVKPDAIICAINPHDDMELVNRTLSTVFSFCKTKLLFYVMSPFEKSTKAYRKDTDELLVENRLLSKKEYEEQLRNKSEMVALPVLNILDKANDKFILETIENAFSQLPN